MNEAFTIFLVFLLWLGLMVMDIQETAWIQKDVALITNLKAECEKVHQTECEISVYYLPKASVPYDRE